MTIVARHGGRQGFAVPSAHGPRRCATNHKGTKALRQDASLLIEPERRQDCQSPGDAVAGRVGTPARESARRQSDTTEAPKSLGRAWTQQFDANIPPKLDVTELCPIGSADRRELVACLAQMFREVRSERARDGEQKHDAERLREAPGRLMTIAQDVVVPATGDTRQTPDSTVADRRVSHGLRSGSRLPRLGSTLA